MSESAQFMSDEHIEATMDIADRLRRPLVSHATREDMPNRALARKLVDDRSDALVEITQRRAEVVRLKAALGRALGYCDGAIHQTEQYHDERGDLVRILND